jgi:catechol 2,3-dioxygenase-like lactoylglutathione lyase family enzyme
MLDHIGFPVADFERSKDFYSKALAPLGYKLLKGYDYAAIGEPGGYAGFGDTRPQFWIGTGSPVTGRLHVAFVARSRALVCAFYEAAIAVGGRDNGPPGLRPHYHENYFGAFVFDPDGHNVEAVTHLPE